MADHSMFSPSAAERWMHCPGSLHMARMFPSSSSAAAEEGSLAHELAEAKINGRTDLDDLHSRIDEFYKNHPEQPGSFTDMVDYLDPYVDYVNATYQAALKEDPSAVLMTEQRIDYSEIAPGGFGTADVIIIGGGCATIIDLKFGKGVKVSARENPQIRIYAYGVVEAFNLVYDFTNVKMVIYQPRLDSVTEETMTVENLTAWALFEVKPAAKDALSENPTYRPGEWCTSHFCPGAGACKARADYALALERHSGKDPALLTDEELSDALTRAAILESWAKALNKYALDEAVAGHAIPGWKVIESVSKRVFSDEDKVADAAVKAGYDRALLYKSSLIGITEMEKLMGKKNFGKVLGDLVIKPKGKPKLAPESDEKPAFDVKKSIKDEFDDEDELPF